uniref:Cation-transporting ATPase n=1 Tax=Hirondellea gigas TaxID=1518452 RepID=A0A6A7FU09_9CRUS
MSHRPNNLPLCSRGRGAPNNRVPHPSHGLSPRSPPSTMEEKCLLSPTGESAAAVAATNSGPPVTRKDAEYINVGEEDQSEIIGYTRSSLKTAATWMCVVVTAGLLRLVFHWQPKWMLYCTHTRCNLQHATRILIVEEYKKYKRYFVKEVITLKASQIRLEQDYSVLSAGVASMDKGGPSAACPPSSKPPEPQQQPGGGSCRVPSETWSAPDAGAQHHQQLAGEPLRSLLVPNSRGFINERSSVRLFRCKKTTYLWDEDDRNFYKLPHLSTGQSTSSLHACRGLSWQDQVRRRAVYGDNCISVPVTPIPKLLFQEALNPFYIFQLFSVILWYTDEYRYYATVIVVTSVVSLVSEVYQMHKNQVILRKTIQSSDVTEVMRANGQAEKIPSEQLVPGDVLLVPAHGCTMHCDAVLLQGNAIVNESMLTGESVPVTKTPVANKHGLMYSDKEHGKHTLFCGTKVIQTRFYGGERVRAVVVRTGFGTNKGALVRSIMYPPPVDFKFQQDSYKFVLVLVSIASFGFLYTVVTKFMRNVSVAEIALDSLDLITIVIPPALPMAMTVGILYALRRLKKKNIFCISPRSVNISGVLNCVCFDKTGTLTEDGLDMRGVVPVNGRVDLKGSVRKNSKSHDQSSKSHGQSTSKTNNKPNDSPVKIYMDSLDKEPMNLPQNHLLFAMATCHSITIIKNELVGDPLELRMFESTGWVLTEPGMDDTNKYDMIMPTSVHPPATNGFSADDHIQQLEFGIVRQFPFESSLQRMTVITRRLGDHHWDLYCKGSPEKIASLSTHESMPPNFNSELRSYTDQGYRVLALAHRTISMPYHRVHKVDREEVECNLQFLGLLVMENRLKQETKVVIQQLHQANIRTVMVTGDNLLTALSVGRECGLVSPQDTVLELKKPPTGGVCYEPTTPPQDASDSVSVDIDGNNDGSSKGGDGGGDISNPAGRIVLAVDGSSWAALQDDWQQLEAVLVRGVVFARMNPDQKQQLITHLQAIGYYVGMCGDGANDCGALKAAHAGISLSEAEASVASPFTSKEPNISCVPNLIREGRTALVTSFGVFKYMAAYSLTQFVSIMIFYSIDSNLTDFQFLYIDLFLITVFAILFGRTESYKGNLHPTSPPAALMSFTPIASLLLQMSLVITFQTFVFYYVQKQSWYVPFNATTSDVIIAGHENYAVFSVSIFQYIILAVVFSRGPPYRQPIYTNWLLSGSIIIMTCLSVYIVVWPNQTFIDLFDMVLPPDEPEAWSFRYQLVLLALLNSALAMIVEYFVVDYLIYQKIRPMVSNVEKSKKIYLSIDMRLQSDKKWACSSPAPGTHSYSHEIVNDEGSVTQRHPPLPVVQYQSAL